MKIDEAIAALPETVEGIVTFLTLNGYSGKPEDAQLCPIANYLRMTTGREVLVYGDIVEDFATMAEYSAPEALSEFVRAFDAGFYADLVLYSE